MGIVGGRAVRVGGDHYYRSHFARLIVNGGAVIFHFCLGPSFARAIYIMVAFRRVVCPFPWMNGRKAVDKVTWS